MTTASLSITVNGSRNWTPASPTITGSNLRTWTPLPVNYRDPPAVIVDFASIIATYMPSKATRFAFIFKNDAYMSGEGLRTFLLNFPIQALIECCLCTHREESDYQNSFWEGLEAIGSAYLEANEIEEGTLEAIDLLGSYLIESVDDLLAERFLHVGLSPMARFDFFFDRWITPTTAILTHSNFNTAETT